MSHVCRYNFSIQISFLIQNELIIEIIRACRPFNPFHQQSVDLTVVQVNSTVYRNITYRSLKLINRPTATYTETRPIEA